MFSEELKSQLRNVHAYAVTPFLKDDIARLDTDGFARNLDFLIGQGVRVLSIGGGTGEINALSANELANLCQVGLETAAGRALVIPTVPGNLRTALELLPQYEAMDAQVVLGMAPYTRNQIPDDLEGVYSHYHILSDHTVLPLMPYNTQGWPPEFFVRLADIDRIIGVKDPCLVPHNLFAAIQLLGDRFVWIGNKRHNPGVLHLRFQMGIEGFTAGIVNFAPQFELELFRLAQDGAWDALVDRQTRLAPIENLRTQFGDVSLLKA
ncbi:MAG: dihydrodipicolinate synthase family protein, partial [Candidatus Latescibacterota bacterium]|nr:dihydrodipicolinate synthase family protein [Candidatus Latescibacterota bacterium]